MHWRFLRLPVAGNLFPDPFPDAAQNFGQALLRGQSAEQTVQICCVVALGQDLAADKLLETHEGVVEYLGDCQSWTEGTL